MALCAPIQTSWKGQLHPGEGCCRPGGRITSAQFLLAAGWKSDSQCDFAPSGPFSCLPKELYQEYQLNKSRLFPAAAFLELVRLLAPAATGWHRSEPPSCLGKCHRCYCFRGGIGFMLHQSHTSPARNSCPWHTHTVFTSSVYSLPSASQMFQLNQILLLQFSLKHAPLPFCSSSDQLYSISFACKNPTRNCEHLLWFKQTPQPSRSMFEVQGKPRHCSQAIHQVSDPQNFQTADKQLAFPLTCYQAKKHSSVPSFLLQIYFSRARIKPVSLWERTLNRGRVRSVTAGHRTLAHIFSLVRHIPCWWALLWFLWCFCCPVNHIFATSTAQRAELPLAYKNSLWSTLWFTFQMRSTRFWGWLQISNMTLFSQNRAQILLSHILLSPLCHEGVPESDHCRKWWDLIEQPLKTIHWGS